MDLEGHIVRTSFCYTKTSILHADTVANARSGRTLSGQTFDFFLRLPQPTVSVSHIDPSVNCEHFSLLQNTMNSLPFMNGLPRCLGDFPSSTRILRHIMHGHCRRFSTFTLFVYGMPM